MKRIICGSLLICSVGFHAAILRAVEYPGSSASSSAASALDTDSTYWESELDELVVTGTRVPRLLKATPVQTRLITSADIAKADASDIQDLLQTELPGVEFTYAMNQQTHLNFSGFGGQSILFLLDGERLAGETMDDVDFSRLDMNGIERIEIVRGAASALYGSNAGGGVVNIITKRASRPWQVSASGKWARHDEQRYRLNVSAGNAKVSNVFSGSFNSIHNFNVKNGPDPVSRVVTTIYGNRSWVLSDRLTFNPVSGLSITAKAGYFFRQLTREVNAPERYRDYTVGLRARWEFNADNNAELSYNFDQYDKSDFYRISHLDVRSYSNVQNSFRGLYNHSFGEDVLSIGADYMHDYLNNRKLEHGVHEQDQFDIFAQFDWIISPKWEAVGALRYDYFSDGDVSRVTPKLSLRYQPISALNIRFSYGMGFRAPTLKEKYYEFDMAGIWIVKGDPGLKPETSHNFNLSAEYTRGHFNYTLTGYYNDIHERISTGLPYYIPGEGTQLYLNYENLSRCRVGGVEVAIQAKWNNGFGGKVSYAYTDEHVNKDKSGNIANNQYLPARKHALNARFDWEKSWKAGWMFTASLNGRFLSGVDNTEYKNYYNISEGTVKVHYPAYTIWKLSLSQKLTRYVSVTLALDNLFNYRPKYYYLNCPLTDGINLQAGVTIDLYK